MQNYQKLYIRHETKDILRKSKKDSDRDIQSAKETIKFGKAFTFRNDCIKDISVPLTSVFLLKYISIIKDFFANSIRGLTFRDTFV